MPPGKQHPYTIQIDTGVKKQLNDRFIVRLPFRIFLFNPKSHMNKLYHSSPEQTNST